MIVKICVAKLSSHEDDGDSVDDDADKHERDAVVGHESGCARCTDDREQIGEMVCATRNHANCRRAGTHSSGDGCVFSDAVAMAQLRDERDLRAKAEHNSD